jgi:hypothetical protein
MGRNRGSNRGATAWLAGLATLVALVMAGAPERAEAQVRLGVSTGFGRVVGADFDGIEGGWTFGGEVTYILPRGERGDFEIGGWVDYSLYGFATEEDQSMDDLLLLAGFRYIFPATGPKFFLGGKGGYTGQTVDTGDSTSERTGWALGPVAGLRVPFRSVDLDVAVDALYQSLGEVTPREEPEFLDDPAGVRVVLRVGLSVPLGGV